MDFYRDAFTPSRFEDLKMQVARSNTDIIDKLSSHCTTLDLKDPVHIQVQLVLMGKIHELEDELDALSTLTYQKYLSKRTRL